MNRCLTGLLLLASLQMSMAQNPDISPRWLNGFWQARWIACPGVSGTQFGVYHFRKKLELKEATQRFLIHVSADNRYRLYVNGFAIGAGPARSDLANWNFETYDIAPYLKKGANIIAATVWNFADHRPYAQISFETAFIVQGDGAAESVINTNDSWKVLHDESYSVLPVDRKKVPYYMVVAQGETVNASRFPWGFETPGYDDADWKNAAVLWYPPKSKSYGTDGNWHLVPRSIPLEESKMEYFSKLVRPASVKDFGQLSVNGKVGYTVPGNTRISLLLDQSHLTNAYPQLMVSKGRNASVTMSYAEALFDTAMRKGNRDSTGGKTLLGISDRFVSDGGDRRRYSPLHYRTFRYLQLDIETKEEPLQIDELYSAFTGYPFEEKARFHTDVKDLDKIWATGWRTARLCAVDTYFDCPYYEQLQYVGDTRIQALISLYVSGDDRLMKKAIDDLAHSFIPEGLTQSRYPSRDLQVIPTFSLWWVCMLHDFWMHRSDDGFIKEKLGKITSILNWYNDRMDNNGLLGPLSWWQFTDWSWPWVDSIRVGGVSPGVSTGGSVIVSLQYAYTLDKAADLMDYFGDKATADKYKSLAGRIKSSVFEKCWVKEKGLLADVPGKNSFSQHANILGVLTDAIPPEWQSRVLDNIIKDSALTQATYYFKFYLFEALKKTQKGDRFLELLGPWFKMLDRGLTTFAEEDDPTRSDCHAWSASPNYEFLSLVCGIMPGGKGFEKVTISPSLGKLKEVEGSIPHPKGTIKVNLKLNGEGKLEAMVEVPDQVEVFFNWKGKQMHWEGGPKLFVL